MFELTVACKYLIPRWRQLSVSIISLISMMVIALVVWLIVVFFSVKDGLEASWIDKLISLTAPVRITPTEQYYHSYYYLVDSISANSNYALKTIAEKLESEDSNPYDSSYDEEPPQTWAKPDLNADGSLKDPVKLAFQSLGTIKDIPGLQASDFEMTVGTLRLRLLRKQTHPEVTFARIPKQNFLEQNAYIGTFDPEASSLAKALLPLSSADLTNLLNMLEVSSENIKEDQPEKVVSLPAPVFHERLEAYFTQLNISKLKVPVGGWALPLHLLPANKEFKGLMAIKKDRILGIYLPTTNRHLSALQHRLKEDGYTTEKVELKILDGKLAVKKQSEPWQPLLGGISLFIDEGTLFDAKLNTASVQQAKKSQDLRFSLQFSLQGTPIKGETALGPLEIAQSDFIPQDNISNFWLSKTVTDGKLTLTLPIDPQIGEGILLPRSFKDSGALAGDQGFLSYFTATASSVQEQRIPVFVAGFYDPGIMPIGGKYVLANRETAAMIRSAYGNQEDAVLNNGINVRFDHLEQAQNVKNQLIQLFKEQGISAYWRVETYQEYEFTKDLIQQLHSEKNLFTLISTVIIIVACSNIISMLIILVNDKKQEIGILRSMGASSKSIAGIFGVCGIVMGTIGSLVGISAALLTLRYLEFLVGLISRAQGYDLFNPVFYGETLPNEVSYEALLFVVLATAVISLLAGVVPAVKASLIRPSAILRSE